MATNDPARFAQIVDMLRVLGYGDDVLGRPGSFAIPRDEKTFLDMLRATGITNDDLSRAQKMIGIDITKPLGVAEFLRTMGLNEGAIDDVFKRSGVDIRNTRVDWTPKMDAVLGNVAQTFGQTVGNYLFFGKIDPALATTAPQAPQGPPAATGPAPLPGDVRAVDKAVAPPPPKPTPTDQPKGPGSGTTIPTPNLGRATPDYSKMTDAELEKELRKTFGKNVWVLNIPEIKEIVFREMRNPSGVTQDVIDSAIQATPWWQQNGQKVADFLQAQATDPETQRNQIESKTTTVRNKAAQYGISLSDEQILAIATDWQKWGWDDNLLNQAIAAEFDTVEGESTGFIDALRADARNWLVPLSEGTIDTWGRRLITGGEAEKNNWNNFLKQQAISMWPGLADRLNNGETTMQIATPYANLAAQYLEMDVGEIDFMKPQWMAALDTVDEKGVHKSLSPTEWVRKIKTDSVYRYDYTEQAKKQATGMATDLLKKFGVM